jgi:hypothetical protein
MAKISIAPKLNAFLVALNQSRGSEFRSSPKTEKYIRKIRAASAAELIQISDKIKEINSPTSKAASRIFWLMAIDKISKY